MEDEAKISKVNSLKIVNQWRKIMRLAKSEALKKDIEILSQNHERDVDRKDAILQMLDRYRIHVICSIWHILSTTLTTSEIWKRPRINTKWPSGLI